MRVTIFLVAVLLATALGEIRLKRAPKKTTPAVDKRGDGDIVINLNKGDAEKANKACVDRAKEESDHREYTTAALSYDLCNKGNSKFHNFLLDKDEGDGGKASDVCCLSKTGYCSQNPATKIDDGDILMKKESPLKCSNDADCKNTEYKCTEDNMCCPKLADSAKCNDKSEFAADAGGMGCTEKDSCWTNIDEADKKTACLATNANKLCCAAKEEHICPGRLWSPLSDDAGQFITDCDDVTMFKHEGLCCPVIASHQLSLDSAPWKLQKQEDVAKCRNNDDCDSTSFCDVGVHFGFGKNTSLHRRMCFPLPTSHGSISKPQGSVGFPVCNDNCDGYCIGITGLPLNLTACIHYTCPEHGDFTTVDKKGGLATEVCDTTCGSKPDKKRFCRRNDKSQTKTNVCCDYDRLDLTCPWPDSKPMTDATFKNVIICSNNSGCGEGICYKADESQSEGYCCSAVKCDDNYAIKNMERECTDGDHSSCGMVNIKGRDMNVGKCEGGRCCPIVSGRRVEVPYITNTPCSNTKDCGGNDKYCNEDKLCAYYGTRSEHYGLGNVLCTGEKEGECPIVEGKARTICVIKNAVEGIGTQSGVCLLEPEIRIKTADAPRVKKPYLYAAIAALCLSFVFAILAIISFLKYRSRHFCDSRKKKNNKKDKSRGKDKKKGKRDEKTSDGDEKDPASVTDTLKKE